MPQGFFPAVDREAPVHPLLEQLRPAVEAEIERFDGTDVTVHGELRAVRGSDGGVELERFYWSTQYPDPSSPQGFSARTLYRDEQASSLQVHVFPSDPALSWLDDDNGPLRCEGRIESVDILRYIPLRRLTYRLHHGAGLPDSVIVKTKGTGGLNRATVAFLAVNRAAARRASSVRVPQLLRLEPPRHALYLEELPGEPLNLALAGLDLTAAMEQLGSLHRDVQALEVKGLSARGTGYWLHESRRAVDRVELFAPSVAGRTRELYADLTRTAPEDGQTMFCQGDFLPGQVLCHDSGWSVLDFDDSHFADPLSEVAAMYLAMPRELGLPAGETEHARRTYLEAYAAHSGEPFDGDRWRWWLVMHQLTQLAKRLMKGRVAPGEAESVLDLLDSGEDGLG